MLKPAPRITGCPDYESYLKHFGTTVTVAEFAADASGRPLTALRHDVDYSIDAALKLAAVEHRHGIRSTWFVLHSASYWNDPRLLDNCLQLQDWGHEVGLHTNPLAEWYRGEIDDVAARLSELLGHLRNGGLRVTGVAAHGDALCYQAGFTNYWLFKDIRPSDPATAEHGVTAEGSPLGKDQRRIDYPAAGHQLTRPDGASFDYWSLSLADFGLTYEGSRVPMDAYYSDSGGAWKRSIDPMAAEFGKNRSLVLMHPLYWRAPQRHYYFLSTARSGSKWLARFLDEATSVTARHEFTLNHRLVGDDIKPEKRTGAGFTGLLQDREAALMLIEEAREWSESLLTDYAEANIYLERFLEDLSSLPETMLIHLKRDPADVARSLLQRGWYEVPFDDRHPAVAIDGWESLGQLEKVCHYVADANSRLAEKCTHTLAFDRMVSDVAYLTEFLERIGITVYPRLAQRVFGERVNQTVRFDVSPVSEWPAAEREVLESIIGGYKPGPHSVANDHALRNGTELRPQSRILLPPLDAILYHTTGHGPGKQNSISDLTAKNATVAGLGDALRLSFNAGTHGHILLGPGTWHGMKTGFSVLGAQRLPPPGWDYTIGEILTVGHGIDQTKSAGEVRVLCLSYGPDGHLIGHRDVALLSDKEPSVVRHFKPMRGASRFNVALYHASGDDGAELCLNRLELVATDGRQLQNMSPERVLSNARQQAADIAPAGVN